MRDDPCPRPEACVLAHPCRTCGADQGQPCPVREPARDPHIGTAERIEEIATRIWRCAWCNRLSFTAFFTGYCAKCRYWKPWQSL